MKRKVIDELIRWKTEEHNIPVLLKGAKGVGKTYLACDYAKAFFKHICYINFEREPRLTQLFQPDCENDPCRRLMDYFRITEDTLREERILILDEISFSKEVLLAIRKEQLLPAFEYIIAVSCHPLPEEQEQNYFKINIHPLEFDEFLRATSNEWYIEAILNHFNTDKKIPEIVHKELLALYQLYLQIGGMPGSINEYLNLLSAFNIPEQHSFITGSYRDYILKDNSYGDALKMQQVLDSLVHQLMKDNRKFQYKIIRKGTTHAMYREAIHMLSEQNYIIRCNRINSEQLSRPAEFDVFSIFKDEENTNFKLYLPDTGVLYSQILEEQGRENIHQYEKALLENYMAQSLHAQNYPFAFWESDSMAKVDFILFKKEELIPIEIFTGENTRSKSISVLKQRCEFPYSIKISSRNFEFTNQIKYVPYYAVFCI